MATPREELLHSFQARRDGQTFRYDVRRKLGTGGGGIVYLAERVRAVDVEAGAAGGAEGVVAPGMEAADAEERTVTIAIKVAHQQLKYQAALATEARMLAELTAKRVCPERIVRILSGPEPLVPMGVARELFPAFIELEFLDGKTLQGWFDEEWFRGGPPDPLEAVDKLIELGIPIAEALAALGAANIAHRDVKAANIMVTAAGPKLFDFNVAREAPEEMSTYVGTPASMAPEVQSRSGYTMTADLYSLGCVLWEIAHGRPFQGQGTLTEDSPRVKWPQAPMDELDPALGAIVADLLQSLVCRAEYRLRDAKAALDLLADLRRQRRAGERSLGVVAGRLPGFDLIQLLCELRPSGEGAVVADSLAQSPVSDYLRQRGHITDPLEDYLVERVRAGLGGSPGAPRLVVLAGNAGDGKSHLIERIVRQRLSPAERGGVRYVADATHAGAPGQSREARLASFFAAAMRGEGPGVWLIAINTGMIVRFFEGATSPRRGGAEAEGYAGVGPAEWAGLYHTLKLRLGLERGEPEGTWVEVVNLDLRSLLHRVDDAPSFAEQMLARLAPGTEGGITAPVAGDCEECSARRLCPVRFNLEALTDPARPAFRNAVLHYLGRAERDPEVHLSPRNLWGFWYRLLTGGVERFEGAEAAGGYCDRVRAKVTQGDKDWLGAGHASELLFTQGHAGVLWRSLSEDDPAFSDVRELDDLHTRLGIDPQLPWSRESIERLGGTEGLLAGLALAQLENLDEQGRVPAEVRDAAVRRQALFDPSKAGVLDRRGHYGDFVKLLAAYDEFSRLRDKRTLPPEHQGPLKELSALVGEVLLKSHGTRYGQGRRLLRISQPNVRGSSHLLVEASVGSWDELFSPVRLVVEDAQIAAHADRRELLRLLGYRPRVVTLRIGGDDGGPGRRLVVDRDLFAFLMRVRGGQQPSKRDLSRFQALAHIGEDLGNALAARQRGPVFIRRAEGGLVRLGRDAFGSWSFEEVSE